MKKVLLACLLVISGAMAANAQKVSTRVVDNKGTIKWVLDSTTAVITKADSTLLFVTPSQLKDTLVKYVKNADTAAMLSHYANNANSGLTQTGQTVQLGGALLQPTTITTTGTNFLAITGLTSGSSATDSLIVVDPSTGKMKFISASSLFNSLKFGNGLTKSGDSVKLGGTLTEPTTIATSATNVLNIPGLQSGSLATDSIVVVTAADGTLKKVSAASLLLSGEQSFTATGGQTSYSVTGMPANPSRVWVYRNGAKLVGGANTTATSDFSVAAGVLTLIPNTIAPNDWTVSAGDVIEVQWVK